MFNTILSLVSLIPLTFLDFVLTHVFLISLILLSTEKVSSESSSRMEIHLKSPTVYFFHENKVIMIPQLGRSFGRSKSL